MKTIIYLKYNYKIWIKNKKGLIKRNGRLGSEMIGDSTGGSMKYPEDHSCHRQKDEKILNKILTKLYIIV
jgi:hypothetical protein